MIIKKKYNQSNRHFKVTENIKKLPYAMQKITINDQEAILVLKNAKNDNLHWVDAENSEIVTRSGKIIKTYNLPNNIETISYELGADNSILGKWEKKGTLNQLMGAIKSVSDGKAEVLSRSDLKAIFHINT